jgi:hypothetical protein
MIAFLSDATVLCHFGLWSPTPAESMAQIPARGLMNVAFPPRVAPRELVRVLARDARVLLSDCIHPAAAFDARDLGALASSARAMAARRRGRHGRRLSG